MSNPACSHIFGPLSIETNGKGYLRAVCSRCGFEGPWRKGLTLTAIRAALALAKKQRRVQGVSEQPRLF